MFLNQRNYKMVILLKCKILHKFNFDNNLENETFGTHLIIIIK